MDNAIAVETAILLIFFFFLLFRFLFLFIRLLRVLFPILMRTSAACVTTNGMCTCCLIWFVLIWHELFTHRIHQYIYNECSIVWDFEWRKETKTFNESVWGIEVVWRYFSLKRCNRTNMSEGKEEDEKTHHRIVTPSSIITIASLWVVHSFKCIYCKLLALFTFGKLKMACRTDSPEYVHMV